MHWSHKYIGYSYNQYNCAQLCKEVLAEEFGFDLVLPSYSDNLKDQSEKIESNKNKYLTETLIPSEGDCVLMDAKYESCHLGVFVHIDGVDYVLHSMKAFGSVCLHKVRDIDKLGLKIRGYYRWQM